MFRVYRVFQNTTNPVSIMRYNSNTIYNNHSRMPSPTLSLVINTRNEAKNIANCIKSMGSLADEIIVMDMASDDDTKSIARSLGAKVYNHKPMGYVEPARQAALKKATSDWILLLDADEHITPKLTQEIRGLIKSSDLYVVAIPRKNIIFDHWFKGGGYWPNYQVRLFRKGAVTWTDTIHADPITKHEIHYLPAKKNLALQHHVTTDPQHFLARTDAYTNFETSFESFVQQHGYSAQSILNYTRSAFGQSYFDQELSKDAFPGFIMSKLMETYRFAEVAKYWLKHDTITPKNWSAIQHALNVEHQFRESTTYRIWLACRQIKLRMQAVVRQLRRGF